MFFKRKLDTFDDFGNTNTIRLGLPGGSVLKIEGGLRVDAGGQLRLCFARGEPDDQGWWVSQQALKDLIAQLLYVAVDFKAAKAQALEEDVHGQREGEVEWGKVAEWGMAQPLHIAAPGAGEDEEEDNP